MKWLNKKAYKLVDYFRKTDAANTFKKIQEIQWWSKEELDEHQFDLYKKLLIHCKENAPYYSKHLD